MHEFSLAPIVIVLLVSVITVVCCRKFNIPSMLGYLLVGFLAGPSMLSLIPKSDATDYLGEIGIVFLMFSIGLEFSLPKLKAMRRQSFCRSLCLNSEYRNKGIARIVPRPTSTKHRREP